MHFSAMPHRSVALHTVWQYQLTAPFLCLMILVTFLALQHHLDQFFALKKTETRKCLDVKHLYPQDLIFKIDGREAASNAPLILLFAAFCNNPTDIMNAFPK